MDNTDKQMVNLQIDAGTVKMIVGMCKILDPSSFFTARLQDQFLKVLDSTGKAPAPGQPAKLEIVEKEPEAKK